MDYEEFLSQFTDYKPITTFFSDLSIAERFGLDAVHETYKRAFREWKSNYKYLTELVMVLNHKIWQWYSVNPQSPYVSTYHNLWIKTRNYAEDNLKNDELSYYYRVTD